MKIIVYTGGRRVYVINNGQPEDMMGLDITVYRQLTPIPGAVYDEDLWETQWQPGEWSEEQWPGRGEGVDSSTVYSFAEKWSFRAGSYGGYNSWRDELKKLAAQIGGGVFNELIDFADNEGVIGPVVAAKLASDFRENITATEEFSRQIEDGGWFITKYNDWLRAFKMASDGGAVDFH